MPDILEERDWNFLLRKIKDGKCTPFLGAGAYSGEIPVSFIANEWAKKYDYPMGDSYDLTQVAQFVAVTEEDALTPKDEICKKIKELVEEVTPKYFKNPDELHGVLADLPLPVYITTNYDDLMVRALKSRGKTPIQEICRWNECLMQRKPILSDFVPTPEKPLVYHIHGCYEIPESLVLTEDDYFDFFVANSREHDRFPPCVQDALTGTSLLLLGYRVTDWDFRVLFRILAGYLGRSVSRKHISVQFVPENIPETQKEKAKKYLDRYFANLHIQVYWHGCREFASELRTRWEIFNLDTIKNIGSMHGIARNSEPMKTITYPTNTDRFKAEYKRPGQIEEEANMVSILFLAADPTDASRLRLGEEFREIQEKLKLAKLRDNFRLELPQMSVRPSDISQALLDTQPQIVHFSGHGTPTGALCFENLVGKAHPIGPDALAALFEQFSGQVNCVVLNACYAEIQAKAIAKHIKYVIGMNQAIGDKAAIAFATGFYQALGGGRSIDDAYRLGCVQIQLQNIPEHLTPVLIKEFQS
ncbi:SIR2 family protein [Methanosarcina sp.]|uniref:SIR2 family protein n=1 Tax=Methanosarcina sp. TaxID=2213 RepID=UPI002ABA1D8F|nr:SIR2 family protein [Methanosarcina sp.]MDY9927799.1 SIR2 family protein [Methanosarcina sp.]